MLKTGQIIVDGIPVLRPTCLIPFKMKAYLDLSMRKKSGEHVDSKNIKKHKNDVFRLAQVIALDTRQMVSAEILEDMKQFLGLVENDNVDLKTIGIKEISYKTMIEILYRCYFTKD